MKQLIGLVHLGPLTALYAALCGAHRQTETTETTHNLYPKKPDRQAEPEGELVLLGFDGTCARSKSGAPRNVTRALMDFISADGVKRPVFCPRFLGFDGKCGENGVRHHLRVESPVSASSA